MYKQHIFCGSELDGGLSALCGLSDVERKTGKLKGAI